MLIYMYKIYSLLLILALVIGAQNHAAAPSAEIRNEQESEASPSLGMETQSEEKDLEDGEISEASPSPGLETQSEEKDLEDGEINESPAPKRQKHTRDEQLSLFDETADVSIPDGTLLCDSITLRINAAKDY